MKMSPTSRVRMGLLPALAATALAAACTTVPPRNSALEAARASYQEAAADPLVSRSPAALAELRRAEQALSAAEAAWQQGGQPDGVGHLAYLANRQADIAQEQARLEQAEQTVAGARAERDRVLLEARSRDLALAESRARELARAEEEASRQAGLQARQAAEAEARALAAEQQAQEAAARAAELQSSLEALAAQPTPRGMVVTLGDVLFDVGEATVKPGATRHLDRLAEFMQAHPERTVRIEGFTDSTGSADFNQRLSERRAEAVRRELVARGVETSRIESMGFGPDYPVASNETAAGRQQNRRVEIVISDEQGRVANR